MTVFMLDQNYFSMFCHMSRYLFVNNAIKTWNVLLLDLQKYIKLHE